MSSEPLAGAPPGAAESPPGRGPGRLALLCTPRSGNNWLRHLLGVLYGMPTRSVHTPDEVDWDRAPEDWLFAIHWRPTPPFVERLRRHGFRVLVLARHPLDVLISTLQFCWRSDSTARWLEGEGGDERPLWGAMPRSAAFLRYAAGPRAAALLSVSAEWRRLPGSVTVRYEDLVADGPGTLTRLAEALGGRPHKTVAEALEAATLPAMRVVTGCRYHFWQGKPGLWKALLTAAEVEVLAGALAPLPAELGYPCDPDPGLTPAQADDNWINLVGKDLVNDLRSLERLQGELAEVRGGLANSGGALREMKAELGWRRGVVDDQRAELEWRRAVQEQQAAELEWRRGVEERQAAELEHWREIHSAQQAEAALIRTANEALNEELGRLRLRLAPLEGIGPAALGLIRRLQWLGRRVPLAAALGEPVLRLIAGRGTGNATKAS